MITHCTLQIATDCNENIRRAENEVKLFAITKRFPHDEVEVVSARWVTRNGEHTGVGPEGGCVHYNNNYVLIS